MLYKFLEDLVQIHRKVRRTGNRRELRNDEYNITIDKDGICVSCNRENRNDTTVSYDILILRDNNIAIDHPNNVSTAHDMRSSFMRMSSGTEVLLKEYYGSDEKVLDIPRYNDNEDELRFSLSTVTECDLEIVLMSILFTLSTHLTTMYTCNLGESDIKGISLLMEKAKECTF